MPRLVVKNVCRSFNSSNAIVSPASSPFRALGVNGVAQAVADHVDTNGAYAEARHIYIKCGVEYLWIKLSEEKLSEEKLSGHKLEIAVYDIGLGTALNAIATLCWQEELLAKGAEVPHIHYNGIEKYPIDPQEAQKLNFPEHIAAYNALQNTTQNSSQKTTQNAWCE